MESSLLWGNLNTFVELELAFEVSIVSLTILYDGESQFETLSAQLIMWLALGKNQVDYRNVQSANNRSVPRQHTGLPKDTGLGILRTNAKWRWKESKWRIAKPLSEA
uniref:Uncharacterized protein n=1 Tax=Solanum tuberosum TaxID=4113 RepID=M1DSA7_SOLTU